MANAIPPQKALGHSEHPAQRVEKFSDPEALLKLHNRGLVVCHIVLGENQGGGTGFLIGKDLIMTNNHVLDSLGRARGAKALFFHTTRLKSVQVDLDPDNFFYTSLTPDPLGFKPLTKKNLDFTIVSIKSHPKIAEVSHLAFSIFGTPIPEKGSRANMIHHPHQGTTYQKISHRENLIKEVALFTIHYTTATLPGSSGAPVIDDDGNLIALHRATCTHILRSLLEREMLKALLHELFPGVSFVNQTLILMDAQSKQEIKFTGLCATIDDFPLYIFSEGELKGQYFYQGKIASLFRLIEDGYPSPKKWALQFLNSRLAEPLADYHCECNTAVSIKAIHDHLKNANLLTQIQACYEESQKSLYNLLKESYLQKCASLPLILTNAAFPIESFFTQLSIVSHFSQEKKEEEARRRDPHLIEKDSLREIYARLCETEKPIEIGTLFDHRENRPTRRVLVLGRAGIGKSTLCQKIVYDWATGILFKQFELVYHIKLRDFNSQKKFIGEWLSQMIAESCYGGVHQEKIHQELQTNPKKILLIFDGWDEASPELIQALETYFRQTQVHYLLTSRPGVTSRVHGNFDLIVENMGFSRTQVETYIEKFFAHTQCPGADLFLKMLCSRTTLLTIAHIPIQLQILCALWQKGEQEFPQTLAPLFSKIIQHLFAWEQKRGDPIKKPAPLEHLLLYQALGEVALKGLESKQLIIPKKMIEMTLVERSSEDNRFREISYEKLIGTGLVKECGENEEVYFLHLIYQEYSIAKYISSLRWSHRKEADNQQRIFIQTYRYKPHFHLVIRMLAGCIWEDSKNISTMETFFEWLYSGHTDLIGGYQTELVLSCLDECQSLELEKRIWGKYKIGDFIDFILERNARRKCLGRLMAFSTPVFMQVVQYLEKVWTQQKGLRCLSWFFTNIDQYVNEERAPKILNLIYIAVLRSQSSFDITYVIHALGKLMTHVDQKHFSQFVKMLQATLDYQDKRVYENAAEILAGLVAHVEKENIPQILNLLQAHPKSKVHVLNKLADRPGKEYIPQILNELRLVLRETNAYERISVVNTFEKLAAHAEKNEILQILKELQMALRDQEKYVRATAVETLGKLATHVGKDDDLHILKSLQEMLYDQDKHVRREAGIALGKLAAHAGKECIPQILNGIRKVLKNQNWKLHSTAIEAFERLAAHAGKEYTSQIFNELQEVLRNQDRNGRKAVVSALGELAAHAEKKNIPRILNEIQIALKDQDPGVRYVAVSVLAKLATHGGKEYIPQIIKELQEALWDGDSHVPSAAAFALGQLTAYVKKDNIPQILNGILAAPDHLIKRSATVEALVALATHEEKNYTVQILNWIPIFLRDPNNFVRWTVAKSLGKLSAHSEKEHIPQILNWIPALLRDQDPAVRSTVVARILSELKIERLLLVFTSPLLSHSALTSVIFDHFINQSIPLYFLENSGSLHTSETCCEAFDLTQLPSLTQLCSDLMKGSETS